MSRRVPSGLKAVDTAWPAVKSGRVGRPGLSDKKFAPGAASGVIHAPVGRRMGPLSPVGFSLDLSVAPTGSTFSLQAPIRIDILSNAEIARPLMLPPCAVRNRAAVYYGAGGGLAKVGSILPNAPSDLEFSGT